MTFEKIKTMKKLKIRNLIRQKLEEKTLEKLENKKKGQSKVKKLEDNRMIMQKYLQPNSEKYSKEDAQLIVWLRGKMTYVKTNFKGNYDQLECRACHSEEEDQQAQICAY